MLSKQTAQWKVLDTSDRTASPPFPAVCSLVERRSALMYHALSLCALPRVLPSPASCPLRAFPSRSPAALAETWPNSQSIRLVGPRVHPTRALTLAPSPAPGFSCLLVFWLPVSCVFAALAHFSLGFSFFHGFIHAVRNSPLVLYVNCKLIIAFLRKRA